MKSKLNQYQIMDFVPAPESLPATCLAGPANWNLYSQLMPRPRTVRFPIERSMGVLYAVRGDVTWRRERCGQELGEARGEVIVPAGKKLQLCVSRESSCDLSPLAALPPTALQMLCFDDPRQVSDDQLMHIRGLWNLEYLNLSDTAISDNGLRHLSEMVQLKTLKLSKTSVSDVGLLNLERMAKLRYLDLCATLVRDPELRSIQTLTALELLWLPCGLLDHADFETLRTALPNRSAQILYEECFHNHADLLWLRIGWLKKRDAV